MGNDDPNIRKAMRIAASPAGQALLGLLQQNSSPQLQQAMDSAAAGDYDQAKQLLSALVRDPKVKKLLDQMGGSYGANGR